MSELLPDRNRPHHEIRPLATRPTIIFLTACTTHRRHVLANPTAHSAIVEAWKAASAWRVGRYVIMPDHVHLFVTPGQPELPLGNWVKYWKREVAKTLGAGVWQEDYWDRTLRSNENYNEKWNYVVRNPERADLVKRWEEWPFQGELNQFVW